MTDLDRRRAATFAAAAELRALADALAASEPDAEALEQLAISARELRTGFRAAPRLPGALASIDSPGVADRSFNPAVGLGNPASPPLTVKATPDGAMCDFTLGRRFEGPPGFVHGGIAGLVLDEVLGRAALLNGRWGMTAYLNITYREGLPLDTPLHATAFIDSTSGRKTFVRGRIVRAVDPDRVCVEADSLFVYPRSDRIAEYFGDVSDADGRRVDLDFGG